MADGAMPDFLATSPIVITLRAQPRRDLRGFLKEKSGFAAASHEQHAALLPELGQREGARLGTWNHAVRETTIADLLNGLDHFGLLEVARDAQRDREVDGPHHHHIDARH